MKDTQERLDYLKANKGDSRFNKLLDEFYRLNQDGMFDSDDEKDQAISDWADKVDRLAHQCGDR